MEIADDRAHRALAYVDAVSRHGHALTVDEFNAYITRPTRRGESPIPEHIFEQMTRGIRISFTPKTPPETVLEWLERLRWLWADSGHVAITSLGRAVLQALDDASREEELDAELVLDPDDELSYPRLIGAIAGEGDNVMLVDGYFSIDHLLQIVARTGVTRVLVRPGHNNTDRARVAALGEAVERQRIDRPFEVKSSDDIHDRFVVPESGPVMFLGTSLSGVGKRLAVAGRFADGATSDVLRRLVERAWKAGTAIAAAQSLEQDDEDTTAAEPATASAKPKRKPAPRARASSKRKAS